MLLEAGADETICDMNGKDALEYFNDVVVESRKRGDEGFPAEMGAMKEALAGGRPRSGLSSFIKENDVEGTMSYLEGKVEDKEKNYGLLFAVQEIASLVDNDSDNADAYKSLTNIIESVLASGADPDMGGVETGAAMPLEKAPLHVACSSFCAAYARSSFPAKLAAPFVEQTVRSLRKKGASISAETESILSDASRRGRIAVVQFLVGVVGVNPNVRGRQGMTSLHFAARGGKVDVVEWLMKSTNGMLDSSIVDDANKKAVDYAAANNNEVIIHLLKSAD